MQTWISRGAGSRAVSVLLALVLFAALASLPVPASASGGPRTSASIPNAHPDLVVTDISWTPNTPNVGDSIKFTASYKNQGNASTADAIVSPYAQYGGIFNIAWYLDGSVAAQSSHSAMAPGDTASAVYTYSAQAQGNHTISFAVNTSNSVYDSNRSNDNLQKTFTINVQPTPTPTATQTPTPTWTPTPSPQPPTSTPQQQPSNTTPDCQHYTLSMSQPGGSTPPGGQVPLSGGGFIPNGQVRILGVSGSPIAPIPVSSDGFFGVNFTISQDTPPGDYTLTFIEDVGQQQAVCTYNLNPSFVLHVRTNSGSTPTATPTSQQPTPTVQAAIPTSTPNQVQFYCEGAGKVSAECFGPANPPCFLSLAGPNAQCASPNKDHRVLLLVPGIVFDPTGLVLQDCDHQEQCDTIGRVFSQDPKKPSGLIPNALMSSRLDEIGFSKINEIPFSYSLGRVGGFVNPTTYAVADNYQPIDDSAKLLSVYIAILMRLDPNVQVDILAHSMGGVVTARSISIIRSTPSLMGLLDHIQIVVVADSPLQGVDLAVIHQRVAGLDWYSNPSNDSGLLPGSPIIAQIQAVPTYYSHFFAVTNASDMFIWSDIAHFGNTATAGDLTHNWAKCLGWGYNANDADPSGLNHAFGHLTIFGSDEGSKLITGILANQQIPASSGATYQLAHECPEWNSLPNSLHRDARYFGSTSMRVDSDAIWDYFTHRGGVDTFGYPISRTFKLQGFTVQFFQRRVIQLDGNGQPRMLNVLDPGLMPYTAFNGSTVPGVDNGLIGSAPAATDLPGVLGFVRQHAPDDISGAQVHFNQTFNSTVSAQAALTNGGDPGLLPGFDLEMWGLPTSAPAVDPNNHDFVYQRFQRGVMHYQAICKCTEGLLLVDYLKSILTGQNLPPDVDAEAQGSPFYKQYDKTQPGWVHDPNRLPNTDLTNAFEPEAQ